MLSRSRDVYANPSVSEHFDQAVNTEAINLPTLEITDSRLRDTEKVCRL
jgi:hypothetical protein